MKFVCDRCSTRYSISDEKVAGKVLKIRCKTCGNIIVVREQGVTSQAAEAQQQQQRQPAAAAGGGARSAPRTELDLGTTAPRGQSPTSVDWFVAIKGKQHGPMSQDDISALYRQGKITARSYCWNEGLAGWVRLRELPDFASLIASGQGPAPQPKAPPPPPNEDGGGQVVDLQQHRQERAAASGEHQNPAAANDPFAAVTSGVPAANQAPRESTRVFIMNAGLANRGKKHRIYAGVASAVVVLVVGLFAADFYGYIEIPLLHNVVTYAAESAGLEEPEKRKTKRFVSDMSDDERLALRCQLSPEEPECIAVAKRLAKKRRRRRVASGGNGALGGDLDLGDLSGAFGTEGGENANIGRTKLTAAELDELKGSNPELAAKLAAMLKGDGPARNSARVRDDPKFKDKGVAAGLPLSQAQISPVFRNNATAVKSCVEQALKRGEPIPRKETLSVLILPKGVVGRSRLANASTAATPLGQCITKAAKRMKFPPFAGEAFEVDSPLVLGGG